MHTSYRSGLNGMRHLSYSCSASNSRIKFDLLRTQINGWTALHWAAKRNNMRIVETLVKSGADINLYTSKGEQAYQLASNEHIAKVLMTKEAVAKRRRQQSAGSAGSRSRDSVSRAAACVYGSN